MQKGFFLCSVFIFLFYFRLFCVAICTSSSVSLSLNLNAFSKTKFKTFLNERHISIHTAVYAYFFPVLLFIVEIIFVVLLLLLLLHSNRHCVQCAICEHYFFAVVVVFSLAICVWGEFCVEKVKKKEVTKVNKQMYDKYWLEILRVLFVPVSFFLFI